jgi:hypothetical protein
MIGLDRLEEMIRKIVLCLVPARQSNRVVAKHFPNQLARVGQQGSKSTRRFWAQTSCVGSAPSRHESRRAPLCSRPRLPRVTLFEENVCHVY